MARRIVATSIELFITMVLSYASPVAAQFVRQDVWQPYGSVNAMAIAGNTLYVGGSFGTFGLFLGNFPELDVVTGRVRNLSVLQNSGSASVNLAVPDGAGGWYLGGYGLSGGRQLIHILPNGSLSPWDLGVGGVTALAVSGTVLYVGGDFSSAGGKPRNGLAAFNLSTGHVTPWNPNLGYKPGSGLQVRTILVSGAIVYVGGTFSSVGGQPRSNIAAVDNATGQPLIWAPDANNRVNALLDCGGLICAAGEFTDIGGASRSRLAMLDPISGQATQWVADSDGDVRALARQGSSIVAVGFFGTIGGQTRTRAAMIDSGTGAIADWHVSGIDSAISVAVEGSRIIIAWHGSPALGRVSCFDAADGQKRWEAKMSRWLTLVVADQRGGVFVGDAGSLELGGTRNNLAAIDLITGEPTDWNPSANGIVRSLQLAGDRLYVGGDFTNINGQVRNRLAALSISTGQLAPWNPNTDESVRTLAVADGGTIYAGGDFLSIGGTSRSYVAALDTVTGQATSWRADADDWVSTLAVDANTIYAGGWFTSIGGQARNRIAALALADGHVSVWNPGANGPVHALAVQDARVFVAGSFTSIGGSAYRPGLAALDELTGQATSWDPSVSIWGGSGYALTPAADAVYVGGSFYVAADWSRNLPMSRMVAGLDPWSAQRTAWSAVDSSFGGSVRALLRTSDGLIAGGEFGTSGGLMVVADASTLAVPSTPPLREQGALAQNRPNPFQKGTLIHFTLARGGTPRLEIFDVQGRVILTVLDGKWLAPGEHDVRVILSDVEAGLYWYRLTVDRWSIAKRMVSLR